MTTLLPREPVEEVRRLLLDPTALVRAVASGRQRNATVPFRRVEARYVDLRAGRQLQVTSYDDRQAHTRNIAPADAEEEVDRLLASGYASWHVETTAEIYQLRTTKKGRPLVHREVKDTGHVEPPDRRHDRVKRRRLDASDPMFAALGVTTADGTVKPTRVPKFRQVQDLLAALDPLIAPALALGPGEQLSAQRPLRVVDLGCGNAYLTFAAFRYLTAVKGLPVEVTGIDLSAQARAHNAEVAEQLGCGSAVSFLESTIAAADLPEPPDLVMALHACDTATDEALARAVRWRAPVIVAAPCCHHDIASQLRAENTPAAYRLITRHGILKERLADVLTDGLRAAILRLVGYRVEVVEFVDSRHTPRNALIRAVRTDAPRRAGQLEAYRELVDTWQVEPALVRMLRPDHDIV